jgi:FkbM family methyltransferase
MSIISYAQNYEDVLLNRVFGGQQIGFYVDVGAYHPVVGSVTKLFYDRGWSGINVEPGSVFELLSEQRPRDVNLRMAVLDYAGETSFLETVPDAGMSHVVESDGGYTVRCDTLESIVHNHGMGRPVDFAKIDAEGAEAAVVRSTDWRRLRPRVMVIESTKPWSSVLTNDSWEPALLSVGYVRAYFDGINCFYVTEEEWPILERHFRVPVNVLDGVVTLAHHEALGRLAVVEGKLGRSEAQLTAAQHKLAHSEAEVTVAQHKLAHSEAEVTVAQHKLAHSEAELTAAQGKLESSEAELTAAQRKLAETEANLANLRGEHDQAVSAAALLRQELDAASTELGRRDHHIREPITPKSALVTEPRVVPRRPLHRRVAHLCYRLVRPVVRPASWRARTFLNGPILTEIGTIQDRLSRIDERIAHPQAAAQLEHLARSTAEFHAGTSAQLDHFARSTAEFHTGSSGRFKQLAKAIEDVVMTLAISSPRQLAGEAAPNGSRERSTWHVLRLPRGRHADFEVTAADLSVGAALDSSKGDWEPHVRRYFESVVKPDWVCIDIGANFGVHSLSLAVLALKGRVIGFEADPVNYDVLTRNAAALPQPKANIEQVHVALWDTPGYLTLGTADELATCSFVTCDAIDTTAAEERLRAVVDAGAIGELELHPRLSHVAGVRLDDWVLDHPLPRLDLVKLDVEGAEANVIRGADQTLRRLQPRLLVEYNPACAAAYFGQPANALYHELIKRFAVINIIEPDGALTPILDWAALEVRLAAGKGWEDLLCLPNAEVPVGTACG